MAADGGVEEEFAFFATKAFCNIAAKPPCWPALIPDTGTEGAPEERLALLVLPFSTTPPPTLGALLSLVSAFFKELPFLILANKASLSNGTEGTPGGFELPPLKDGGGRGGGGGPAIMVTGY